MIIFLLIWIFNVVLTGAFDLTEGDECILKTGKRGTCINGHKCESAINLLASKQTPEICGFDGLTPIVCCSKTMPTTRQRTREIGEISNRKCKEFYPYPVPRKFISGGQPAHLGEFRHMALVGFGEENNIQWQCGGSLISFNYVITAAHCLSSLELGPARWVRLGDLDISTDSDAAKPQQFHIRRRISHPKYERPSRYHDLALLELDKPINDTGLVSPACLDTLRNHNETEMIATGWGKIEFAGDYSNHLLKTTLNVVPRAVCEIPYRDIKSQLPNGIDDELQICAVGHFNQDTCQGDSGGPLKIEGPHENAGTAYYIVGITSFGKACGISKTPGIYTRVFNYLTWIEDIVWSSE